MIKNKGFYIAVTCTVLTTAALYQLAVRVKSLQTAKSFEDHVPTVADGRTCEAIDRAVIAVLTERREEFPNGRLRRITEHWGDSTVPIARKYGRAGLELIEWFNDEESLRSQLYAVPPAEFAQLVSLSGLEPFRRQLISKAWRIAILRLGQQQKLSQFADRLQQLHPVQLELLKKHPDSLALLIFPSKRDCIENQLRRNGTTASQLMSIAALSGSSERIELVAHALDSCSDLVPMTKEIGPLASLAFVPLENRSDEHEVSRELLNATDYLRKKRHYDLAARLAASNRETVRRHILRGGNCDRLRANATELFVGATAERLEEYSATPCLGAILMSTYGDRQVGLEVLQKFGTPACAEWCYEKFKHDNLILAKILMAVADTDEYGLNALVHFADDPRFLQLFDRIQFNTNDRFAGDLLSCLARGGKSALNELCSASNPRFQCNLMLYPEEKSLLASFVLPDNVITQVNRWRNGAVVYPSAILWAVIDDVGAISLASSVSRKISKLAFQQLAGGVMKAESRLATQLIEDGFEQSLLRKTPRTPISIDRFHRTVNQTLRSFEKMDDHLSRYWLTTIVVRITTENADEINELIKHMSPQSVKDQQLSIESRLLEESL